MQSLFSKWSSVGVLALGLAIIPATLPAAAQSDKSSAQGSSATTPATSQSGNAASTTNGNDNNGTAANPNSDQNPSQAATSPTGRAGDNPDGGSKAGLWGLLGLAGLFGLAGRGRRAASIETRDRDIDRNRRVA